jgi:hypothetical protein
MAFNRRNYYRKIIKVQDIVTEKQRLGITNTRIFEEFIKDEFNISKRTFDEYLGIPAKNKLKELEQQEPKN